jgi:hypothetical protein
MIFMDKVSKKHNKKIKVDNSNHSKSKKTEEHKFEEELKEHFNEAIDTFKEMKQIKKFTLKQEFQNAIEIIILNTNKIKEIAKNKSASGIAMFFVIISYLAFSFGLYIPSLKYGFLTSYYLLFTFFSILMFLISVFLYNFIADKVFKAEKGTYAELFRVIGYGAVVLILGIFRYFIPILAFFALAWFIVVSYKAIEIIKKLNLIHIVFTLFITIIIIVLLNILLMPFFSLGTAVYLHFF